jgi:alpha-mannosidase
VSRPRLHVVALSHLDTQWRWTVRDTVERFLPATVEANERLFERFPDYVLSFEGSYRYRLLAEHHPALFERVRERAATGRWHPAGAAVEAFDALLPAPESIVRQILYGRRWFRRELGRDSRDLFLPDCFGFPATLPTLAAHLGLIGFSTQKLRRGTLMRSAFGIPFTFGRWRGPDGGEILAALDPGEYSGRIEGDLTRDAGQLARFAELTAAGVPPRRLLYVGIGDRGGAVPAETVHRLTAALAGDGPIEVRHGPSEQLFAETSDAERDALPSYAGELLLRVHATGCYTAKALLKRWNRRVEQLARIAETAVAAALVAGHPAPRRRLEDAWLLLLAHQMHDDLTGTAIPDAYRFTLADLGLAANELGEITLDAVATVAETLGSEGTGLSLLAVTPLGVAVDEVVEIADLPAGVTATEDADGERRPVQRLAGPAGASRALISLTATGAGVQRLHLRSGVVAPPAGGAAEAGDGWLENGRYRAELGADGALRSLVDKRLGRELLAAPPELELLPDRSAKYPAWEILWSDASSPPRGRVDGAPRVEIVERGPLRATLAVERRARGVVVRERWSLAAGGAGELLGAEIEIDWHRRASLLKARFELAAENDQALYDTGLGAIARPVASERLYEVPAQHWAAIVDRSGDFGVALFADARHGWDQPDGRTLRSTWIHAPRASFKWRHQATQDFGVHRFRFAIAGLPGDAVARGAVAALADRFVHRPWLGWHSRDGAGANDGAPRRKTLVSIPGPARLLALKAAEDDDRLVLRLSNPAASSCAPAIRSSLPELAQLTPCCGMESPSSAVTSGTLLPAGIATLASAPIVLPDLLQTGCAPLGLPWSQRMATANGERGPGDGFDGDGRFLPLELLPARLDETVVPFDLEHGRRRRGDGLAARGETIELPAGSVEVWLLAAAVGGEREVEFALDGVACRLRAPDWRAPLLHEPKRRALLPATAAARFLRRPTAWSCGHLHDRRGHDLAVDRATLFALRVPAAGARRLRLPDCPELRIVAATVAGRTQRPLFDALPVELA